MNDDRIQPPHQYDEDEIDLLDLLLVLAKRKKFIFLTTTLFAVMAIVASLIMTPIYKADVRLIPPASGDAGMAALSAMGGFAGLAKSAMGLKTPSDLIVGVVKSRAVLDRVIDRFGLMDRKSETPLSKFLANFRKEKPDKAKEKGPLRTDVRTALTGSLSANSDAKTGIISISVSDRDPQMAADMTNGIVEELVDVMQKLAVTQAAQQRLFLEKQVQDTQLNLIKAENALVEYQKASGILDAGTQASALMSSVANFRAKVAAKEVELRTARTFATSNNLQVQKLQTQLKSLKEQLKGLEARASGTELDGFNLSQFPNAGLEYFRKVRDQKFYQTLYNMLLQQYESAKIQEASNPAVIQVVDQAVVPELRDKPKRKLMVVLATVLGFFMSVFGAFVKEFVANASEDPERKQKMAELKAHLSLRRKRA